MKLEDYYYEFLNQEMSRDFLSIGKYAMDIASRNFPQLTMSNIMKHRCDFNSKMFYSISISKNGKRLSDRLFFDFDLEDKEYKEITSSEKARKMLYDSNILEKPFNEVSMAYDYLKDSGLNPYVVFTSSKGFHLYCFFNPTYIKNISDISMNYAETLKSELNLETIDFAVNKDAQKRKARLPYSRHNKTDLFVVPCDINADIKDILSDALNPSIQDFRMSDYIVDGLSEELEKADIMVSELKMKEKEIMDRKKELKMQSQKDILIDKAVDFSTINMRHLVRDVASESFVKSMSNYDIYNCPFHADSHHSAGCYEKRFFCSACGKSWNYYDFIAEYYGLDEPKEIMNEVKKHL